MAGELYNIKVETSEGATISLADFKDKVLIIVNVASQCAFTPQYGQLQSLFDRYQEHGLEILAFPCNQFGAQEPGDNEAIRYFCELNFSVGFPIFSKIEVNGDNACELYQFLKKEKPGLLGFESIKWNFTKFLVSRKGEVLHRYAPSTKPYEIEDEIKAALGLS